MPDLRLLHPAPMKETAKAKAAYAAYAAMGKGRSLRKLAEQEDKSGTKTGQLFKQYGRWSAIHSWQNRVAEYDREREEEKRRVREADIEKMDIEHSTLARSMLIQSVGKLKQRMDSNEIGAYALVQLFDKASSLERIARGAPTDRSELTGKDGESLLSGASVVFYLPKVEGQEEPEGGGDANANSHAS